jgi:hypothetical protein
MIYLFVRLPQRQRENPEEKVLSVPYLLTVSHRSERLYRVAYPIFGRDPAFQRQACPLASSLDAKWSEQDVSKIVEFWGKSYERDGRSCRNGYTKKRPAQVISYGDCNVRTSFRRD